MYLKIKLSKLPNCQACRLCVSYFIGHLVICLWVTWHSYTVLASMRLIIRTEWNAKEEDWVPGPQLPVNSVHTELHQLVYNVGPWLLTPSWDECKPWPSTGCTSLMLCTTHYFKMQTQREWQKSRKHISFRYSTDVDILFAQWVMLLATEVSN